MNLIIPILFLIVFVFLTVTGSEFVTSWKSFLIGILFALSVVDVGKAAVKRLKR